MKKAFFLVFIVFLASAYEEMDAVVIGASGAAALTGTGSLGVYNCKIQTQADPWIEFAITRSAQCREALVVYYEAYDFVERNFSAGGQLCIIPPSANCRASVPIKLGGMGRGSIDVKLVRLKGQCEGVDYVKEFVFTINHRPDPVEENVLSRLASSNSTAAQVEEVLAACGQCCQSAEINSRLDEFRALSSTAMQKLARCEVTNATGDAGMSLQKTEEALFIAQEKYYDCVTAGNVTGNISGNVTVYNASGGAGPGKTCGIFAALLSAVLIAVWGEASYGDS